MLFWLNLLFGNTLTSPDDGGTSQSTAGSTTNNFIFWVFVDDNWSTDEISHTMEFGDFISETDRAGTSITVQVTNLTDFTLWSTGSVTKNIELIGHYHLQLVGYKVKN